MSEATAKSDPPVTRSLIEAAYARILGHIRTTPVMTLPRGSLGGDFVPVLKLELHQHAGSFKARGAFNNLCSREVPSSGVAAASGGNHGVAVAYAAKMLGRKATIFVPEISSPAKIARIRAFGATTVVGGARYADALRACESFVAETGALSVHAFDSVHTMAGQGTLALEWDEQAGRLDSALVATGGGGLVAGMGAWWHGATAENGPRTRAIAVEPEGSTALYSALQAGGPVDVSVESIAADSLGASNVGPLVYSVATRAVDHVIRVPDSAIQEAQATLWREYRIATEPGGATAFSAILCGGYKPSPGERVGILVCGGNVDLKQLAVIAS